MNVVNNLLAPIDTPAAWHGTALAASDAWRRQLTVAEIAALERATEAVRDATCPGFGPGVFPVPELAPLFAYGLAMVRLSGLPAHHFSGDLRGGAIAGRSALL
jgi:hypothetical protein